MRHARREFGLRRRSLTRDEVDRTAAAVAQGSEGESTTMDGVCHDGYKCIAGLECGARCSPLPL